jgi:hypothetical protein
VVEEAIPLDSAPGETVNLALFHDRMLIRSLTVPSEEIMSGCDIEAEDFG